MSTILFREIKKKAGGGGKVKRLLVALSTPSPPVDGQVELDCVAWFFLFFLI